MRRPHLRLALCGLLFSLAVAPASADAPPNIVVIIADDLGSDDLGCYGNRDVRTPHLDRLAGESMRFERFFLTASSCSPSRSSMFSGRYPHNTGAMNLHTDMKPSVELFIEPLRAAGYHTMLVGKSHGTNNPEVRKKFDRLNLADWSRPWVMADTWETAVRERPKDRPFFLWAASIDPHRPFKQGETPFRHDRAKITLPSYLPDTPEMREEFADYLDEISRFDEHVGRLLRCLAEEKVLEHTVVFVLSDNGSPFQHGKCRVNLPGVRSPLLVRYPALVLGGTVSNRLASAVDLAPTILELAGAAPLHQTDGHSLVPMLRDPTQRVRDVAFAEHNWHTYRAFERAAITEDHLYIRNWLPELTNPPPGEVVPMPSYQASLRLFDEGRLTPAQADVFVAPRPAEELFSLVRDPQCLANIAAAPAEAATLARLRAELERWQAATDDVFPGVDQLKPDEADRRTGALFPKKGRPAAAGH